MLGAAPPDDDKKPGLARAASFRGPQVLAASPTAAQVTDAPLRATHDPQTEASFFKKQQKPDETRAPEAASGVAKDK